jgi:hypothetical protein
MGSRPKRLALAARSLGCAISSSHDKVPKSHVSTAIQIGTGGL